jgi:hypothetical protein
LFWEVLLSELSLVFSSHAESNKQVYTLLFTGCAYCLWYSGSNIGIWGEGRCIQSKNSRNRHRSCMKGTSFLKKLKVQERKNTALITELSGQWAETKDWRKEKMEGPLGIQGSRIVGFII